METIVVIVVISVALLTLFSSYNKILSKVKAENKYDTPEYVYMTYYVKEYLNELSKTDNSIIVKDISNVNVDGYENKTSDFNTLFGIKKIYILEGIGGTNMTDNLIKFDAYMIDYIKQMDVSYDKPYIIVEYERPDREENSYTEKKMYLNGGTTETLKKTYIASLEW